MTDADKINADLHDAFHGGVCPHDWDLNISGNYQCSMGGGEKEVMTGKLIQACGVPSYTDDGAYILGLAWKYKLSIEWTWWCDYDGRVVYGDPKAGKFIRFDSSEISYRRAVALAALKMEGVVK